MDASLLERRRQLTDALTDSPYDIILYLRRAVVHADLQYPDLAAGDAYRALLLTDEASDESFEYHEQAVEALQQYEQARGRAEEDSEEMPALLQRILASSRKDEKEKDRAEVEDKDKDEEDGFAQRLARAAVSACYVLLAQNLLACGCLSSALDFCDRGLASSSSSSSSPEQQTLARLQQDLEKKKRTTSATGCLPRRGLVRRELYPWNTHEPDRTSDAAVAFLNARLAAAAPKCAVRATELPVLTDPALSSSSSSSSSSSPLTCRQLGLFATADIAPGEPVLREYSLLTANNRHKASMCDACGSALPPMTSAASAAAACPDCDDTVFCDAFCRDQALARYHPAVCDKDVDAIAKDPDARDADDALYVLLLARLLAMAAHEEKHPLEVDEAKYIWGDFSSSSSFSSSVSSPPSLPHPTLPFSFEANIATPLHLLEKMDLDVFATLPLYDVWVLNTLYAKFRGTASARKSSRDGRPDVAAVHPLWCLANHDCDPNVTWEWGGRMVLSARPTRVAWERDGKEGEEGEEGDGSPAERPGGIQAGQEILNHYCDIDLPVQQRREWASGSLGGFCMCRRCQTEAAAEVAEAVETAAT